MHGTGRGTERPLRDGGGVHARHMHRRPGRCGQGAVGIPFRLSSALAPSTGDGQQAQTQQRERRRLGDDAPSEGQVVEHGVPAAHVRQKLGSASGDCSGPVA